MFGSSNNCFLKKVVKKIIFLKECLDKEILAKKNLAQKDCLLDFYNEKSFG